MDGVITSEDGYWRAAACALLDFAVRLGHPTPEGEDLPWQFTPDLAVIARAKALLINTNWDLCHLAAIALAMRLSAPDSRNLQQLRQLDWKREQPVMLKWPKDFVPDLNSLVAEILRRPASDRLRVHGGTGESHRRRPNCSRAKAPSGSGSSSTFRSGSTAGPGGAGIVEDERLLREPDAIAATLCELRHAGWRLGIATGRTREELIPTLMRFELLRYFEDEAVVTHDEVAAAEAELGGTAHLSKPNPFPFSAGTLSPCPGARIALRLQAAPGGTVIVGDTVADIAAAVTIGALPVGVLTGPGGERTRPVLTAAGARILIHRCARFAGRAVTARNRTAHRVEMALPVPNSWVAALPAPKPLAGPHSAGPGDLLLHLGEAWFPPSPEVYAALAGMGDRIARYPDSLSQELRRELATYAGHGLTAENIMTGNGSDGLIDLLISTYAGDGRPVSAPAPTFFVYGHSAALRRAPLLTDGRLPQAAGFSLDPGYVPPASGIVFLASPNNPTGDLLSREASRRIAGSTEAVVVIDECYYEFAGETALALLPRFPNLVILRTLSKSFALAGLRSGYAIAHPQIISALSKADQTFSVNVAAQVASVAALRSLAYYQPLFTRTMELRGEWTAMLLAAGLRVFPSSANILLAEYAGKPLAPALRRIRHSRSRLSRAARRAELFPHQRCGAGGDAPAPGSAELLVERELIAQRLHVVVGGFHGGKLLRERGAHRRRKAGRERLLVLGDGDVLTALGLGENGVIVLRRDGRFDVDPSAMQGAAHAAGVGRGWSRPRSSRATGARPRSSRAAWSIPAPPSADRRISVPSPRCESLLRRLSACGSGRSVRK